jgi:helicase MOV-10
MRADASAEVSRALLQSDVLSKKEFPIVFHGIKGQERRTRQCPSYLNIPEASVVRDYCLRLVGDHEHKICEYRIYLILHWFH